jgi:3-oxoacyl-[acyl-carrier-protein] synthase III
VSCAYLREFGVHLPSRTVTNAEIAPMVGADEAWLLQMTGIAERRFAAPQDTVAGLGLLAARDCLDRAGMQPREIGFIFAASGSSERRFPGPASSIGAALGIPGVPAIDLPIASAGSLVGIAMASHLTETYGNVLVIGAEIMSRAVQVSPLHRDTAILFGDGAGACIVSPGKGLARIVDSVLHTDGDYAEALQLHLDTPLFMDGRSVILHATRKLPRVIQEVLKRNGRKPEDIGAFLLHQANLNLIAKVAQTLGVPESKFYANVQRYGNTSSASVLIAAAEWRNSGGTFDAPVVMAVFGAGFNWGSVLLESPSGE